MPKAEESDAGALEEADASNTDALEEAGSKVRALETGALETEALEVDALEDAEELEAGALEDAGALEAEEPKEPNTEAREASRLFNVVNVSSGTSLLNHRNARV